MNCFFAVGDVKGRLCLRNNEYIVERMHLFLKLEAVLNLFRIKLIGINSKQLLK